MKAQSLGLNGYAKNLPDGRVEVLACGPRDKVGELETWLWEGPPHAEVNAVQGKEVDTSIPSSFKTI